jgi:hypothetical protein
MQHIKLIWVVIVVMVAAALTSCSGGQAPEPTQDANAVYTSVAGTMVSQFNDQQTQTAQAVPPSPQPSPTPFDTFTPLPTYPVTPLVTPIITDTPVIAVLPTSIAGGGTPGSTAAGCNNSNFISETKPDDGTQFTKGENFSKSWTFQNTGTCTWSNSYTFGFQSGDRMGGKDIVISRSVDFTLPGNNHTFTVFFEAPNAAGHYIGFWEMRTPLGGSFGTRVWVVINVK